MTPIDFKTFIDKEAKIDPSDIVSMAVILLIRDDVKFPRTYDMKLMARYLHKRFSHERVTAYQRLLFMWLFRNNNYQPPTDVNLLNDINYIIELERGK